ncbi:hypothetical protein ACXR2T_10560 [Leucobacter sp. HY1910]
MTYKSLVTVNLNFRVLAGNCLAMAQGITGAPIMHPSATVAANNTRYRHAERTLPDAVCVIWLDHWGSYGQPGQETWANWGHVAVYVPGFGIASSSPIAGEVSGPYWYRSIADIERTFNAQFRFWTEDINGHRVCQKEDDIVTPQDIEKVAQRTAQLILDTGVKRTGVDKDGKPRTGNASLRSFLASWEHQVGVTRRIVERIWGKVK